MATITKSVGTASRDYSTVGSWISDLDNDTPYDAGDDAVGEMYDDSTFAGDDTINTGGSLGLNSITLTVAAGERHDGTEGTGARIVAASTNNARIAPYTNMSITISWLEMDGNGQRIDNGLFWNSYPGAYPDRRYQNCILHGVSGAPAYASGIYLSYSRIYITNCIIYDIKPTNTSSEAEGIYAGARNSSSACDFYNITIHNVETYTGSGNSAVGLNASLNQDTVKNCVACGVAGPNSPVDFSFSGGTTHDYNASEDSTATGANSVTGITPSSEFTSLTGGSEDYHLLTGASCKNAGMDPGTTPTNVEIDIDGRDRDAEGDTWDIGADEFVSVGGAANPKGVFGLALDGPMRRVVYP